MKALLLTFIQSRRKVRRADFAVAQLRLEGARARKDGDKDLGRYLGQLANLIEGTP